MLIGIKKQIQLPPTPEAFVYAQARSGRFLGLKFSHDRYGEMATI